MTSTCAPRAALPAVLCCLCLFGTATAEGTRARDLGIPFDGEPGALNAITDVAGVEVGQVTLIDGAGELVVGKGPVRTGVTVIHPRGKESTEGVFAGWFTLNASGEMTGTTWLAERGLIEGPLAITNTHSVGVVRDATVDWMVRAGWSADWHAPVVAETYDGGLNDINGFHVTGAHALEAMRKAGSGPLEEGAVDLDLRRLGQRKHLFALVDYQNCCERQAVADGRQDPAEQRRIAAQRGAHDDLIGIVTDQLAEHPRQVGRDQRRWINQRM